jgi:thioredoxin 1
MKKALSTLFLLVLLLSSLAGCSNAGEAANADEIVPGIPVKGTVTLVDIGATTCVPCKMMAPILEELKKEYKGKAEVIFIDVYDSANAGKAKAFKTLVIPTQIFYDRHGKEVFRHVGFFDKKSISAKLNELLTQK